MATYEVYLADQFGNRIALLDDFSDLEWGRKVNAVGQFSITFASGSFDRDLWWGLDRRLEIWRQPVGGTMRLQMVGFLRHIEQSYDASDRYGITVKGPDAVDLLARRIIDAQAGSANSDRSGNAGDVMKAYVKAEMGSSAAADRDLTDYSFAVQGDAGDGASINKAASRRNLLTVLQEIAEVSYKQDNPIYFDIIHPTPSSFEFRTFAGQRGSDRTVGTDKNAKTFSPEFGYLRNAGLVQDWRKEATYVYAAGKGLEANREVVEVSDTTRLNASIFNRREVLFNGTNMGTNALTDGGRTRLREKRPTRKFTGQLVDSEGARYDLDWSFGDKVTAALAGEQYDVMVASVKAHLDANGRESLTSKLEYLE